jgi:hypothetical protein
MLSFLAAACGRCRKILHTFETRRREQLDLARKTLISLDRAGFGMKIARVTSTLRNKVKALGRAL